MVTDKINILLRADYYGAADGQTSLRSDLSQVFEVTILAADPVEETS